MTYVDLDKGGQPGYATDRMGMGPSLGLYNKANRLERIITTGAASSLQPWDAVIMLNLAVNAAYTLTLLSCATWLKNPYGQIPIQFKFLTDNGGLALTLTPAGIDTIDGLASVQVVPNVGVAPFPSFIIRPRIDNLGWIVV